MAPSKQLLHKPRIEQKFVRRKKASRAGRNVTVRIEFIPATTSQSEVSGQYAFCCYYVCPETLRLTNEAFLRIIILLPRLRQLLTVIGFCSAPMTAALYGADFRALWPDY